MTSDAERHNRRFWDDDADDYQAAASRQLERGASWGVWGIPESQLGVLGDVRGLEVLELGCGAADWARALAAAGARVVGLDQSLRQLSHARRDPSASPDAVRLVCASGTAVPLRPSSFDLVFCDHGALSFCDPDEAVAECGRLLRPGGRLVFNHGTLLHALCWDEKKDRHTAKLRRAISVRGVRLG